MKLISNWRDAWKMFSVQALALIAFAQTTLAVVPSEYLALTVPFTTSTTYSSLLVFLTIAAALIGGITRLIDQGISA